MIEVRHVSKSFGRVRALDDVSLRIQPGERVGFIGTNGSGKTTLLRALLGLVRVDGRITIGGVDVAKEPELALRSVAYIPQVAPPIEAPVVEVVRAFAAIRRMDPARVGVSAGKLGLPLADLMSTRFRDLSGGMKQKLLAAIALSVDAEVLVCDEPTANLDRASRAAFFDEVGARGKNTITILCSHRAEEVSRLVSRVVELTDGRILDEARPRPALPHRQLRVVG
jgi:ABC-2 type transport system ATP-binding protein